MAHLVGGGHLHVATYSGGQGALRGGLSKGVGTQNTDEVVHDLAQEIAT
mgnify:CR=1 FL=1